MNVGFGLILSLYTCSKLCILTYFYSLIFRQFIFLYQLAFQVTVEDPKTGDAVDFPCRRWFAKNEDDGQISRELSRGDGKDGDMVTDKGK